MTCALLYILPQDDTPPAAPLRVGSQSELVQGPVGCGAHRPRGGHARPRRAGRGGLRLTGGVPWIDLLVWKRVRHGSRPIPIHFHVPYTIRFHSADMVNEHSSCMTSTNLWPIFTSLVAAIPASIMLGSWLHEEVIEQLGQPTVHCIMREQSAGGGGCKLTGEAAVGWTPTTNALDSQKSKHIVRCAIARRSRMDEVAQ